MMQELDMPEENIATLICHLEAHPAHWIIEVGTKVCSFPFRIPSPHLWPQIVVVQVYATCTVRCYGGLHQLKTAAQQCPALGAALAMQKQDASSAVRTFSVVDVARHIGWDSGAVKRQLKLIPLSIKRKYVYLTFQLFPLNDFVSLCSLIITSIICFYLHDI